MLWVIDQFDLSCFLYTLPYIAQLLCFVHLLLCFAIKTALNAKTVPCRNNVTCVDFVGFFCGDSLPVPTIINIWSWPHPLNGGKFSKGMIPNFGPAVLEEFLDDPNQHIMEIVDVYLISIGIAVTCRVLWIQRTWIGKGLEDPKLLPCFHGLLVGITPKSPRDS